MNKLFLFLSLCLSSSLVFSQEEEAEEKKKVPQEIGVDMNFGASSFGGTFGLGVKYGFISNEKVIAGPSFRYQRTWSNFNGIKGAFNIYGAGGFIHYRLYEYFFLGAEAEFISSPFTSGNIISPTNSLVPVALIGGGYSKALSKRFRLNAGIMYDLVNHPNSPLRQGYFMRNKFGVLLPVVYRVAFFIPLNYSYTFDKK